jgi:hypothetical protein
VQYATPPLENPDERLTAVEAANALLDGRLDDLEAEDFLQAANDLSEVDPATARANLGASLWIVYPRIPLDADGTFYLDVPVDCTVTKFRARIDGVTTADGAATITIRNGVTPMTGGIMTVSIGTSAGSVDTANPTDLNAVSANGAISLDVAANSQSAAAFATVSILATY